MGFIRYLLRSYIQKLTDYCHFIYCSGGGIAGLVSAAAIQHFSGENHDIKIDIYECARQFTEIGAGVGMYLRPWKAMKTLGFEESLSKLLTHTPREDEDCKWRMSFRSVQATDNLCQRS